RDEVDAVHTDKAELFADRDSQRARAVDEGIVFAGRHKDVAAVAVARRAERFFANQLTRQAKRPGAAARRDEHDGSGRTFNEFLQVAAGRHLFLATPAP